ncbi:MAG: transporter substrate-binding domain-containing protein [Actinomycetota bacterium]|nr:transporter substrate-binding domain-containing protein [Actinomycetota bacterium]
MRGKLSAAGAVVLMLASCSPGNSQRSTPTLIERIRSDGQLLVAVPYEGRPPPGDVNPSLTTYQGFAVEVAREIASSLGVALRFAPSAADAVAHLPARSDIHLSFPLRPLTATLAKRSTLTDPYLTSFGTLMTRAARRLGSRPTLCSSEEPWRIALPARVLRSALSRPSLTACLDLHYAGRVDAIAGPDVALARIAVDECGRCVLSEQRLGRFFLSAVVPQGEVEFADYVGGVVEEAYREGRWRSWYEEWIGRFARGDAAPGFVELDEALEEVTSS